MAQPPNRLMPTLLKHGLTLLSGPNYQICLCAGGLLTQKLILKVNEGDEFALAGLDDEEDYHCEDKSLHHQRHCREGSCRTD